MKTLAEYHSHNNQIADLKESSEKESDEIATLKMKIDKLLIRNDKLSSRNKELLCKNSSMDKTIKSLRSKKERAAIVVLRLWMDGFLSMSKQDIANRLFVDVAYINNTHRALKRAIK